MKPIKLPESLKTAAVMSPPELNGIKFTGNHTVLTPELLKKMKNKP